MSLLATKNVVLALTAQNENGALDAASLSLAFLFQNNGYRVETIPLLALDGCARVLQALKGGDVAFAYAFAGVGSLLETAQGVNLWTAMQTPFLSIWYDHPCYQYRNHQVDSPFVLNCYHVKEHWEVAQKYLPSRNHAVYGGPATCSLAARGQTPWKDKVRTFFFAKSGRNPDDWITYWRQSLPLYAPALESLAEKAKNVSFIDLCEESARLFEEKGWDRGALDIFLGFVQEVDAYIRAWRADRLARALLAYPSDIFGEGWDYLKTEENEGHFLPSFPAAAFTRKAAEYRLCANSSPLWREGVHERVLVGMINGALCLTDRTEASDRLFSSFAHYLPFDWSQDDLSEKMAKAWVLSQEERTPEAQTPGCAGLLHTLAINEENFLVPLEQKLRAMTGGRFTPPDPLQGSPTQDYQEAKIGDITVFYTSVVNRGEVPFAADVVALLRFLLERPPAQRALVVRGYSGAIGFALIAHRLAEHVTLVEPTPAARLAIARTIERNGLADKVSLQASDDLIALEPERAFDLVVGYMAHFSHSGMLTRGERNPRKDSIDSDWRLRRNFFKNVRSRLLPEGRLVMLESSFGSETETFQALLDEAGLRSDGWCWSFLNGQRLWYHFISRDDCRMALNVPMRQWLS